MVSGWDELSTQDLFKQLRSTQDPKLRDYLISHHAGLVRHVAREYAEAGESYEDLLSVGHLGLINAVDRFDPQRGTKFATFAIPTIRGEIQRHFRDRTWGIHVPRRVQELSIQARQAREVLSKRYSRAPTYAELAGELGVSEEELIQAVEVGRHYDLLSLDATTNPAGDDDQSLADQAGTEDPRLDLIADRDQLLQALRQLPPRQQVIIALRYFEELSQQEVGSRLGISQMHVSRLQRQAIDKLRQIFDQTGN